MNIKKLRHKLLPKKLVPLADATYRKSRLGLVHLRYGLPARGMHVIAVTGTNGKTSTCNFINDLLKHAGYRTALFTTATIELDGQMTANTIHRTVPLTGELFSFLKKARMCKTDFVILEVTAHALHQHKVWGIPVDIAVMTNLSQDHLDYFADMNAYAKAKAKLFNAYMRPAVSVLNSDDEWYKFFLDASVAQVYTYGITQDAHMRIRSATSKPDGLSLRLETADASIVTKSPVIGTFNAYNLAAASSVALLLGIQPDELKKAIQHIRPVPGRMETITSSKGFGVVVDYAHTPDALEKALKALHETTSGKVRVVFGATGDRDALKRPIMGKVVAENADAIYLTDDETYSENGDSIRKAVMAGITEARADGKTKEIADRYYAITEAVRDAKRGDMILVAGLGHQDYRGMNEGNIPWQETEVVAKILKENNLA
jgi:UDP-N-acetylmuramoyl-L-alanyl-D-glutamate--2,6-diaminopimelate ligase